MKYIHYYSSEMAGILQKMVSSVSHLFYPHVCRGCGTDLIEAQHLLCFHCLAALPLTHFAAHESNPVEKTFWGRIRVASAMSLLYFTPGSMVQHLIHQLKYDGQQKLAHYLGIMMGNEILRSGRFSNIDHIIPLPLYRTREKERGYNQSFLLATGIAEIINVPVMEKSMIRIQSSLTQTHKSRSERWQNVDGLFRLKSGYSPEGKNILLVDDVITTGATIDACGTVINKIPGTSLNIATLAYALQ
jgi:ComF family protein